MVCLKNLTDSSLWMNLYRIVSKIKTNSIFKIFKITCSENIIARNANSPLIMILKIPKSLMKLMLHIVEIIIE